MSLPNLYIVGLETCLNHCCLDLSVQIFHASPRLSQLIIWKTISGQSVNYIWHLCRDYDGRHGQSSVVLLLILDYRARQQSNDLSHYCWYSFLVTAVLHWLLLCTQLFHPTQSLCEAGFDVHCYSWVEGNHQSVGVMEGQLHCSTVMFGHSRLQMRLRLYVCVGERGIMHVWVKFALWTSTCNVWICMCSLAMSFWESDREPQWGFSSGCSFEPDISVTHHYILLKAVRATVTFYAAVEFLAHM